MDRRTFLLTSAAATVASAFPGALFAQAGKTIFRWVPAADLTLVDPTFTTAVVTQTHSLLIFDTLYALDAQYVPQPQMVESHVTENDGLLWKFTLRDGLRFHDDTPVRAADVVASLRRWGKKDLMVKSLMEATETLSALDDKTIQFKLKSPFPMIRVALSNQSGNVACILPERLASLPETVQIKEMVGSGPFRFMADRWVSGSRVVYEKFAGYVPRKDATTPSFVAGPKIAHVDGVQWNVIPDRATAIAALQAGEVDGVETVDNDFLPMLRADPNITLIKRSLPSIPILRFNHLHAPFNNPAMRRAILGAINQTDYMTAHNGSDFPEFWSDKCGVFVPGSPLASDAGMEKLTGKRDLDKVRADIKAAGYKGEVIVLLDPVDFPSHHASALLTADLFKRLGLNVDVQSIDWGTSVQRRNNQDLPTAGGWSVAFTAVTGTNNLNPAAHMPIRGNGKQAWFGWPVSEKLEQLRKDWFNAPDLETQKKVCRDIQLQVFEDVPYIPLGATYQIMALRKPWKDMQPQFPTFFTLRKG